MRDPDPRDDRVPIGPLDCAASVQRMDRLSALCLDRIELVGQPSENLQDGGLARLLELALGNVCCLLEQGFGLGHQFLQSGPRSVDVVAVPVYSYLPMPPVCRAGHSVAFPFS